jgi:hypothetical protein
MRFPDRLPLLLTAVAALTVVPGAWAQTDETPRFREDLQVSRPVLRGSTTDLIVRFSGPFSLPGISLPAGTYVFRRMASDIVRVQSQDGRHVYLTMHTTPTHREKIGATEALWDANVAGAPVRLKAWFRPGTETGQELSYPVGVDAPRQVASR